MNVRAKSCLSAILSCLLMTAPLAAGYELVVDDRGNRGSNLEFSSTNIPFSAGSVLYVAQRIAHKMMEMYPGNKTNGIPGLFGDPYYWWEAGAVFGALVDYWYYTGDAGYNHVVTEALLHQMGPDQDYMPPNQSKSLGNDDQCFWGLTVISAAEKNFPDPPRDQAQWLALAQAVFNTQALRWDTTTCGGGLRWQIYSFNNGYSYKNTISNGCFFQLAARLARYTNNATYAQWAVRTYDWTHNLGLATPDQRYFDGSDSLANCTAVNWVQWSYNAGTYLAGAAYMYNFTNGDPLWRSRIESILDMTRIFYTTPPFGPTDTMFEQACERPVTCNIDQRSFKAYFARFLALTVKMAPWTASRIMPKLRTSAVAAAAACSYGEDKNTCGMKWYAPQWDGLYGVGEQISALEVIQNTLVHTVGIPVTQEEGGTSVGDPAAGSQGGPSRGRGRGRGGGGTSSSIQEELVARMTRKQRVGAWLATVVTVILTFVFLYWVY